MFWKFLYKILFIFIFYLSKVPHVWLLLRSHVNDMIMIMLNQIRIFVDLFFSNSFVCAYK